MTVSVAALGAAIWTRALAVVEQGAEHHRGLTINGGVDDRHPEFDGPHDRVGDNSSRQRRRLRHRAPRVAGLQWCENLHFLPTGAPLSSPTRPHHRNYRTLSCTPFPEEPIIVDDAFKQRRVKHLRKLCDKPAYH